MERLAQPLDPDDHARGPGDAVELVLYGDYQCPYTRLAYRRVQQVEHAPGGLRFAFRHFPLTEIHPRALPAALAAEAAAAQGAFWEMHDLLFHRQAALEDEDLRGYAATLGLDAERLAREVAGGAHAARIERDRASGRASGVTTTPTVFVDGARHPHPTHRDALRATVEERRAARRRG